MTMTQGHVDLPGKLNRYYACEEAIRWAGSRKWTSAQEAWDACERGDWMLWLLGKFAGLPDSDTRRNLVGCVRDCAQEAWPFVREDDGATAMAIALCDHVVGEYVDGRASLDEVRAARCAAAYAAADAAYAAAAYAAASAADAAYAAAAYAAASADAAAAAYADAAAGGRGDILRRCAGIVRRHYPTAPRPC